MTSEVRIGDARHTAQTILLEELIRGRPICVRCASSSMMPQIIPGDMLTITPVSRDQLQRGDIVLMRAGEEMIAHRLLAIRETAGRKYAVTRGDGVNRLDAPVLLECIVGKVSGIRRDGRERILKNNHAGRLKAWLSLVALQLLDVLRWIKNGRRPVIPPDPLRRLPRPDKKTNNDELLLRCSLPAQNNSAELLRAIAATVGWKRFLTIADTEGLSELIYWNCREQIADGLIPPEACRSLENAYLTTLARNTIFLAQLGQISHALAGLDFIVLKGAYLATNVYASTGMRRFSDIDILVKQANLAEVDHRLAAAGYLPAPTKASTFLNSVMYYPAGNEIAIDVHWHLINSIASNYLNTTMDIGEIWKAARPAQPEALPRPPANAPLELCPEHLLIHLAEHALHHSFERLILLRDIAEVTIRFGEAFDWDRLLGECRKFNLARPVYYSLLFISKKTGVPVPAAALETLRPAHLGRAEKLFIGFALRGRRSPELCNLAYFDSMPSLGAKIRFCLRLVFPCREVMALIYCRRPDEIGPGVYILRLFHGMEYVVHAMIRIFRG